VTFSASNCFDFCTLCHVRLTEFSIIRSYVFIINTSTKLF